MRWRTCGDSTVTTTFAAGPLTAADRCDRCGAQAYVREGVLAGPLEPVDSGGPNADYVLAGC